jgi:hypothetical protein
MPASAAILSRRRSGITVCGDRWAVDALFLARLGCLDQHPARTIALQLGSAAATRRFPPPPRPRHQPLLNDDRLADIEAPIARAGGPAQYRRGPALPGGNGRAGPRQ